MIHKYSLNGFNIVLDICSGAVHVMDELGYELVDYTSADMPEKCPDEAYNALNKFSKE